MDLAPSTMIADRYQVERILGRGGMATVYLCVDTKTGTHVAVKILRPEVGSAVVVERFLREIEFSSELDHPGIPKVLDSGVIGELPFYVMTYARGESLRERLDREKQLPVDEAIRIATAVIDPMTYAHDAGIVHRDIKPGNILVGPDFVHVLDFGIARAILASADERLTSTGMAVGTPAYMSPEQALADGTLDARSDIYSLGCVLYEMIAGLPPFVGATPQAIMARRFGSPPPPLSETREGVPPHVDGAVSKALCRAPADRWQTAAEFGRALKNETPTASLHSVRSRVENNRKRYARVIAGVIGAAIVAGAAFAMFSPGADRVHRAEEMIERWDFEGARGQLLDAVRDPENAAAQVWLAGLTFVLGGREAESEWRPYALRGLDGAASLDSAEKAIATILQSTSAHSTGDCDSWRRLASSSPGNAENIIATLALGDCIAGDRLIERDPSSPSGYRFRSSHHEAASVYEGLLTRNSSSARAHAVLMPRLLQVMSTIKTAPRHGFLADTSDSFLVAFPSLVGDTIAYVPYPVPANGVFRTRDPAGLDRAIDRNAGRLKELAAAWVVASPRDHAARETYGQILERNEELDGTEHSALGQIDRARQIAASSSDSAGDAYFTKVRLAATKTRILLKLRRFDEAARLADSVLAWPSRDVSPRIAQQVDDVFASLAALTGRTSRLLAIHGKYAARYPVPAASSPSGFLPAEVGGDAFRLYDFSMMGGPADSITTVAQRVSQKLEGLFPASRLDALRTVILRAPYGLAAPVIGPTLVGALDLAEDPFVKASRALAAADIRRARVHTDSLGAIRSAFAPGEITMDGILEHAWLLTAVDDTAGAVRLLDNALRGLSKMPANTLREGIAASLVRAIMLRAEIALKQNDRRTAETWTSAARALWGNGDPEPRARVTSLGRRR
jgi:serine/threonine protein kinase